MLYILDTGAILQRPEILAHATAGDLLIPQATVDDIRDRARYWGWSIGKAFGEPLINRESTGISSLSSLVR